MDEGEFLTVAEAARALKVHTETLRRWLREGKIQGHMIGGKRSGYRIPRVEVRRILEGGEQ